jgi:hypothetical protein
MQYAKSKMVLVHARVYQNTLVIHIEDACLNVWLIQTAHKMKLAGEINVKILAQGYVVKTQNVRQLTMFQCVHVPMDILGIRSDIVHLSHHNKPQLKQLIHAVHRLVDQIANAENSMVKRYVHVFQNLLEVLLVVDRNV